MKNIAFAPLIIGLSLILTACSSEEPQTSQTVQNTAAPAASKHQPDVVINDEASKSVKAKFAEKFTEVCVERELKAAVNPENEEKRARENCGCIAQYIAENLADPDAEKYIETGEDSRTMQIKFDTATFFCLQNKKQFKGPQLFGKQP